LIGKHLLVADFEQFVPAIDFSDDQVKGCLDAPNAAWGDCFIAQQLKQGDCHFNFNSIDFLVVVVNFNCANFDQNTSGPVELVEIAINEFTVDAKHMQLADYSSRDMVYINFDYRIDLVPLNLS